MLKLLIYVILLTASFTLLAFLTPSGEAFALVSGIAIGFLVPLIDAILSARERLRFAWYTLFAYRQRVRMSMSYLFRIEVEGKYLLIKGRRHEQYQPVGGVFKVYPSGNARLLDFKALRDDLYAVDVEAVDDLRVRIKGKYISAFFRWFDQRRGRETDSWREFHEELIASELVAPKAFTFIRADFRGTRDTGLRYSAFAQSREIVFSEIYNLIPTAGQVDALKRAVEANSMLIWASEDEIRRRGASANRSSLVPISEHSAWIL